MVQYSVLPLPRWPPTLGIIDRTEVSPGEFIDGGTIYLYMKLDLGPAPQGSPGHFFDITLYMPNGTWYVTLQAKTDFTGAAEFSDILAGRRTIRYLDGKR